MHSRRRTTRILIALLALGLRLGVWSMGPAAVGRAAAQPDSGRYLVLAENLRAHGTFGKAEEDGSVHRGLANIRARNGTLPPRDASGLRPEVFRTPAYPAFIAAIHAIGGNDLAVLFVQCLLGTWSCWAAMFVAERLGLSATGSAIVGGLYAAHPALVVFDNMLLTESLFGTLVVGSWLAATRCDARGAGLSGSVLGVSSLVRPVGFLYLPSLALMMTRGGVRRMRNVTICAAIALAIPAVWAVRNARAGEGLRLSTVPTVNLLFYTAAYSTSEASGLDWTVDWPNQVNSLLRRLDAITPEGADVFSVADTLAFEELRARPISAVKVLTKATLKLWLSHSAPEAAEVLNLSYAPSGLFSRIVLGEKGSSGSHAGGWLWVTIAWLLLNIALPAAALAGAVRLMYRREFGLCAALIVPLLLFTAATGSVGLERMRLPMLLPVFLLAALSAPGAIAEIRREAASAN